MKVFCCIAMIALLIVNTAAFDRFEGKILKSGQVIRLNAENVDDLLRFETDERRGLAAVLVAFIEKGEKQRPLEEAAAYLQGMALVTTVLVDGSKASERVLKALELEGVDTLPAFRAFPWARDAALSQSVDFDDLNEARDFIVDAAPALYTDLQELDVERFLGLCMSSRRLPYLFFTEKPGRIILAHRLSYLFNDTVGIGVMVNPSESVRETFRIKSIPEIRVMLPRLDDLDASKQQLQFSTAIYDSVTHGKANFVKLVAWSQQIDDHFRPSGFFDKNLFSDNQQGKSAPEPTTTDAQNALLQEITPATFASVCPDTLLGLCLIGFLNGASNEFEAQKQILTTVNDHPKTQGRKLFFSWVDATCHPEFAEYFQVSGDNLPVVLAIAPSKKLSGRMIGPFTVDGIVQYTGELLMTRHKLGPYQGWPKVQLQHEDCVLYQKEQAAAIASADSGMDESDDILAEILAEERAAGKFRSVDYDEEAEREEEAKRLAEEEAKKKKKNKNKGADKPKKKKKKSKKSKKDDAAPAPEAEATEHVEHKEL